MRPSSFLWGTKGSFWWLWLTWPCRGPPSPRPVRTTYTHIIIFLNRELKNFKGSSGVRCVHVAYVFPAQVVEVLIPLISEDCEQFVDVLVSQEDIAKVLQIASSLREFSDG